MSAADECLTCTEDEHDRCPSSKRPCGHHCNHSWTDGECCWCGHEWEENER